jgi:N-methylhydantoinase A
MLMSDLRRDYFVTRLLELVPENADRLNGLLDEIGIAALEEFEREGAQRGQVRLLRFGKLRYENQEHSVEVALPDGPIDTAAVSAIADTFHESYEREYTYRLDGPVEFVGAHVVAIAEVGKLTPSPLPASGRSVADARKGRRRVDYATEGAHQADIYVGELLEPGMGFTGPAIVEARSTTVVIHPDNEVTVDRYGSVAISLPLSPNSNGAGAR